MSGNSDSDSKILENSENVKSLPLYLPPQETFAEKPESKDSGDCDSGSSESSVSEFSVLDQSDVFIESIDSEYSEEPEEEEEPKFQRQQTASIDAENIGLVIGNKEQAQKWYIESQEHHKTISWQRIVLDQMTNRSDTGYLRYLEAKRAEKQENQQTASIDAEKIGLVIGNKEQAQKWYIESQEHHKTVMVEELLRMSITANVQKVKEAEFQKLREDLEKARSDLFEMDLDRKEKTMELEAAKKTIEGVKSDMKKVLEKL
ncbi:Protein CBG26507 [Caenorhabditis briggsae]|uniref:Protein CBG26507 n=1 Tax=Caenorhabditis briggsae TaxID=6238 RepID=B6ILP0_CAEBR|nr:Protein CBG26507 [Caenorhabditis briggsae]CAS00820.1 Protein CBG26507 [Caenorhabditis briggsae]